MNLSHFSNKPLGKIRSVPQDGETGNLFKPRGLWVSVDGETDWPAWCKSENFGNPDGQYHYRVDLSDDAKILFLKTANDIRGFTKQYSASHPAIPSSPYTMFINWVEVAKKHAGLIITPYQWSCRMEEDTSWYYPWDCASGCIWDGTAVAGVELLRKPKKRRRA